MSFSYDRYDSSRSRNRRHTPLNYWIPLAVTATIATAGVAAWIWSSRSDEESSDDAYLSYGEENEKWDQPPPPGGMGPGAGPQAGMYPHYRDMTGEARSVQSEGVMMGTGMHGEPGIPREMVEEEQSMWNRVGGGLLRRTPSPQAMFDAVGRRVAQAGSMVGGALSSIREDGPGGQGPDEWADHNRWDEEAARRGEVEARARESGRAVDTNIGAFERSVKEGPSRKGQRRKLVAIVLSAEEKGSERVNEGAFNEHASILSHLPTTNPNTTDLVILIYTPPTLSKRGSPTTRSLGSSYSAISNPARTPDEKDDLHPLSPKPEDPSSQHPQLETPTYRSLHSQALDLIPSSSSILPFSTPTGFIHMLRHLSPELVYLTEELTGINGTNAEQIKGWVGQTIVVVGVSIGGGLVDTEDEYEGGGKYREGREEKWWKGSESVGLGKGIEIVDSRNLEEDWERRVGGRE